MEQFNNAFNAIHSEAKKQRMFNKPVTIAIDFHEWLYYGDENGPMVTLTKYKQGTNKAYTFATVNVVEAGSVIRYRMKSTSARKGLLRKEIEFYLIIVRSNKNPEKNVACNKR